MIALEVDDMQKTADYLRTKGVDIVWGPRVRETYSRAEICDPNGYHIELRQWFRRAMLLGQSRKRMPERLKSGGLEKSLSIAGGPRVRISLPPVASQQRTGPLGRSSVSPMSS